MSLTTCTIHAAQRTEKAVFLSSSLIKALKLGKAKTVSLKLGSKSVTVQVRAVKRIGNQIHIPVSIMNLLKIPKTGACSIQSDSINEIRLGPLIGVLTGSGPNAFIKSFVQACAKKSIPFAFTPSDVNWQQETITGYFIHQNGGWSRKTVPLPDIVYNRLHNRKVEATLQINEFKERFVRRNIPLYNWSFFDKSDVYRLLEGEEAHKHVPDSITNPTAAELKEMLEKHKFVYLKPTGGSLGIGIYRLTYAPERGYFARYRSGSRNVLLRFNKFSDLMKLFKNKSIFNQYVAQQGIRLVEIDSCPIDFRFHMTKNGNNEWIVAGIGAKKAGKGSVTTHIRSGGVLMTPEQALKQTFGPKAEAVLDNAKETAVMLAQQIEKNNKYLLGELGFDLGIDQDEKVWMFEANAKPGRSIFKHPSLKSQGRESIENLVDYCLYLSKFRVRRDS